MNFFFQTKWSAPILLTAVVFAVFGQAIWFDYIQLDEGVLLINNRFFISKLSSLLEIFKHDINFPSAVAPYYRPLFIASFIFNSQLGTNPWVYHLGNILLHLAAAFLVFKLLTELEVKPKTALFFSALFAVHPAVTPVVAWVPGRIEAILSIFVLLSWLMFIRFLRTGGGRQLIGFLLFFGLALFTKEVAIALLPILFFYYWGRKKEKGSELIFTPIVGLTALIAFWFLVRQKVMAEIQLSDLSFSQILGQLWANASAIILYLGKTILPFNLTALPAPASSSLFYGWLVLGGLAAYGFWRKGKLFDLSGLGLLWFLVFIVPSLASYRSAQEMVFFEHRLYLPLIGMMLFLAGSFSAFPSFSWSKFKNLTGRLGAAIIVLFAALAFNYSGVYKDQLSFWRKAAADSPRLAEARQGLATAYLLEGKIEQAQAEFEKTLALNPAKKGVHLLLGLYYLEQNSLTLAREELEKEIAIDPNQFVAYHGLGRIYAQGQDLKKAEENFLKTLMINPDFVLVLQDLTVLYFSQNKHPQAIAYLKKLLDRQTLDSLHPQIRKILEIYTQEISSSPSSP